MESCHYRIAGKEGKLTVRVSRIDNDRYCRATGDDNPYHDFNRFRETRVGRKLGSEILTGMMLTNIGNLFSDFAVLARTNNHLALSNMTVRMGSPAVPDQSLTYSALKSKQEDGAYKLDIGLRTTEGQKKKFRDASLTYSGRLKETLRDLSEFRVIISKKVKKSEVEEGMQRVGIWNLREAPFTFWPAYTVSHALLQFKEIDPQLKGKNAFYTALNFEFYEPVQDMAPAMSLMLRRRDSTSESIKTHIKMDEDNNLECLVSMFGNVICSVKTKLQIE